MSAFFKIKMELILFLCVFLSGNYELYKLELLFFLSVKEDFSDGFKNK